MKSLPNHTFPNLRVSRNNVFPSKWMNESLLPQKRRVKYRKKSGKIPTKWAYNIAQWLVSTTQQPDKTPIDKNKWNLNLKMQKCWSAHFVPSLTLMVREKLNWMLGGMELNLLSVQAKAKGRSEEGEEEKEREGEEGKDVRAIQRRIWRCMKGDVEVIRFDGRWPMTFSADVLH